MIGRMIGHTQAQTTQSVAHLAATHQVASERVGEAIKG